jgi:hypothetical protein
MASARVKASIKVMLFMVVFPYVVTYFRTVASAGKRRLPRHVQAPLQSLSAYRQQPKEYRCRRKLNLRRRSRVP